MLLSGAINFGLMDPSGHLAMLDGWGAFSLLLIAVVLESGAYLIPWIDNLLAVVASPAAVVAGIALMGTVLGCETNFDPFVQWSVAAVGGGGAAGTVQAGTVATRAVSTGTTGGLANPIVSIGEAFMAILITVLAILAPLLCLVLVVVGIAYALRAISRQRNKSQTLVST